MERRGDESRFREDAVGRLRAEYDRLRNRLDAIYLDNLDGEIDESFYDRKTRERRPKQDRQLPAVEEHPTGNRTHLDEGDQLVELASRADDLFVREKSREQRRLLDLLLSKSTQKSHRLAATYRQPSDLIEDASRTLKRETAAGADTGGRRLVMGG